MTTLFIGLVAGIVGTAYFMYGKRQSKPVPLIAGMLLCIYPYFSDNALWLYGAGAVLALAPFVLEL